MTDVQGGEAAVVETAPATAPEAVVSSQDTAERDFETEARDMGWRPKDEWTGKPEHWKDAKTYVEFDLVGNRISKIEKSVEERVAKIEKVNAKTIAKLEADHQKELAELRATKKEAIKAGDVDEVERLDQQIEVLKADAPEGKSAKSDDDVQSEWMARNTWYNDDTEMQEVAFGYSNRIRAADVTMAENLRRTEEYIKRKFPDKFGNTTAANGHAAVDGGGNFPGAAKTDALAKLPNEARAQAKSDMAKFPKIYPTADAWVKAYNS